MLDNFSVYTRRTQRRCNENPVATHHTWRRPNFLPTDALYLLFTETSIKYFSK
jgi:hypothetical protein